MFAQRLSQVSSSATLKVAAEADRGIHIADGQVAA